MTHAKSTLAGAALAVVLAYSGAASAGTVKLDFGTTDRANGGAVCTSDCVLPTVGENTFTSGGVTVGAIGYTAAGVSSYLTQKPGVFGDETGLGQADTPSTPDGDHEIAVGHCVLIDNAAAIAAGDTVTSLSVGSLQTHEGALIYGYTGPLNALNTGDLTLLDTFVGTPVTQTATNLAGYDYLVVEGYDGNGDTPGANTLVSQEVLTTPGVPRALDLGDDDRRLREPCFCRLSQAQGERRGQGVLTSGFDLLSDRFAWVGQRSRPGVLFGGRRLSSPSLTISARACRARLRC